MSWVTVMSTGQCSGCDLAVSHCGNSCVPPVEGGEVLFIGTGRDNDADGGVIGLSYSAHPTAEAELKKVTGRSIRHHDQHTTPAGRMISTN
jgi:molybdopterin synthase catalytic subunit